MRFVDAAVIARLETETPAEIEVHEGQTLVRKDPASPLVVTYALPALIYRSSTGDDSNPRLGARRQRRSVFFDLTGIGSTPEQAKGGLEQARAVLERHRFTESDHGGFRHSWPCLLESSTRIFRDDDAINLDGRPLFYGVDSYAVAIMLAAVPA